MIDARRRSAAWWSGSRTARKPPAVRAVGAVGVAALALTSAMTMLAGCDGSPGGRGVDVGDGQRVVLVPMAGVASALRPTTLRVHPLTRVEALMGDERGAAAATAAERAGSGSGVGGAQLVVQLELADEFGHSGKWLGVARLRFEPDAASGGGGGGGVGGGGGGALSAVVDLTDPERNAEHFDWISRTYRVVVRGLARPTMAPDSPTAEGSREVKSEAGEQAAAAPGDAPKVVRGVRGGTVEAQFDFLDEDGRVRTLRASLRVPGT
jgi:hypothetical protein